MKKLFTLLALAGFSAATANPLPIGLANGHQAITPKVVPTTIESFYNNVVANSVDKSNSTQATFTTVIPNVPQAAFTYYNDGTQFQYDPGADALAIYYNTYKLTANGQNISGATINVYTSTNNGIGWANNTLYSQDGPFAIYGSFAFVNPKKSKLFADWNLLGQNMNFVLNAAQTQFEDKGRLFQIKTGSDVQNAPFDGPTSNNALKYGFPLFVQMLPYEKDGKSYVLASGQSFRPSTVATTEDLIKYCFYAFNFEDGEFTASTFPSSLTTSNFASPSPQQTADNYSSVPSMGYDEAGSIYLAIANYMSDDNTMRVPSFTKTTDLGKTWSSLTAMPSSLLTEFTNSKYNEGGADQMSTFIAGPYDQNGFQVTGVNKFSYVIRVQSNNTTKNLGWLNLVECTYDNGSWALKTIAELAAYPRVLALIQNSTSQFNGRTKYDANGQGNEVQLAKTADGNFLVAKWIDEDTLKGVDGNFTLVANNNQNTEQLFTITRLNPTDVFMAYKDLSTGNWSNPVNVTIDLTYQKANKMPMIVPSKDKVPVLFLENSFTTWPAADSAVSKAPTWVRGMFADGYSHPQKLQYASFNSGLASVKDENPVNNGQFQLNPVFPNPASGVSEITFTLNKPGMAKLALINQVGQVVKVIYEGQLSEGLKAVTVNTDELAAGVYYYTLTVGDNSATKVLNVVK